MGYLAPGLYCQWRESQGSAHFPIHCFTVQLFREKKKRNFSLLVMQQALSGVGDCHAQTFLMTNMMDELEVND